MHLYLIERKEGDDADYDNYVSAVVCAPDAEAARRMHPADGSTTPDHSAPETPWWELEQNSWVATLDDVEVTLLGEADVKIEEGVVLSSYFAG